MFFCAAFTFARGLQYPGHFEEWTGIFDWCAWIFYVSKYVEFADTYFLILAGREVSWLHFLHHCGAAPVMGLLHATHNEGVFTFVAFNGVVHTVMYYYYACCILKWQLPKWLKKNITRMQLVQFVSGGLNFYQLSFHDEYWNCSLSGYNNGGKKDEALDEVTDVCFKKRFGFRFAYSYIWMLIVMFSHFYLETYIWKPQKQAAKNEAKSSTAGAPAPAKKASSVPTSCVEFSAASLESTLPGQAVEEAQATKGKEQVKVGSKGTASTAACSEDEDMTMRNRGGKKLSSPSGAGA